MNFKTAMLASALMAFSSVFAMGCGGSACDDLVDHYEECGFNVDGGGDSDSDAECTDQLACQSECIMAQPCGALTGEDADAAAAAAECMAGC